MSQSPTVFNRQAVRRHRSRAAPGLAGYDFLFRETAERLADRLQDVKRRFPLALDLGCHSGQMARALKGRGGVETLIECDLSPAMVRVAAQGTAQEAAQGTAQGTAGGRAPRGLRRLALAADE